jgi:hypothetical protein
MRLRQEAKRERIAAEQERIAAARTAMSERLDRANRGLLDPVAATRLRPTSHESVYLETRGSLLKEVSRREPDLLWGGTKTKRGLVVEDQGTLAITSRRIVFLGARRTVDIPYTKLMGTEFLLDGITLQVAGRVRTITIQFDQSVSELVAATLNTVLEAAR